MDEKRIKEALADETFVKRLLASETPEEARRAFREKGVEVGAAEILKLRDTLLNAARKAEENGGELSMEDMEEVAGGYLDTITNIVITIATNDLKAAFPFLSRW